MTLTKKDLESSETKPVSLKFRYDWQYVVDYLRIPFMKQAAAIIAATPAIVDVNFLETLFGQKASPTVWITWLAAVFYVAFFTVGFLACPRFIKEYRDFGDYKSRGHSARFIGWELRNFLATTGNRTVAQELVEKGLAERIELEDDKRVLAMGRSRAVFDGWSILLPNNVDRNLDVYLVNNATLDLYRIHIDDSRIDESDTLERNIFWVIFSHLASSRENLRFVVWVLLLFSAIFFVCSLGYNSYLVMSSAF